MFNVKWCGELSTHSCGHVYLRMYLLHAQAFVVTLFSKLQESTKGRVNVRIAMR